MHPFFSNPLKTRDDVQQALISLLDPLAQFTSPGGARIKLGHTGVHYDSTAAELEGFARPLWGLASLLAGGGDYPGMERWLRGFESGTDPESPEFWGWTRGKDQRMVEMSPIGYLLATCPEQFWDKLSPKGKQNLSAWLGAINDKEMPPTNWRWFRVFANLGLSKVGAPFSQSQLNIDLEYLDAFYIGGGWSRDGPEGVRQLDYYSSSFAIQVAQLIYSKVAEKEDPVRCAEYRERARLFALDFYYYFDAEGRAIPFGRSMTYRFAMAAFWGALAFANVLPPVPLDSWGVIKGLLLRNIRYWTTQHAILDSAGTLTIGFTYPSTYATENYNSPGSPYWAFKAFIPLALPADHPFWTSEELPHPLTSRSIPLIASLDQPGHIISHLSPSHTFLLSSGQACHYPLRHGAEKYGKLAYSSAFGYAVPTAAYLLDQHAPDSTIALSDDSGERWLVRREVEWARIERGKEEGSTWLRALWKPWKPAGDEESEVDTWLFPPSPETPDWHVRVHRIRLDAKKKGRVLASDAGFSIYGQGKDGRAVNLLEGDDGAASLLSGSSSSTGDETEGKFEGSGATLIRSPVGLSGVVDLISSSPAPNAGFSTTVALRDGKAIILDANANIIFQRSIMPTLLSTLDGADSDIYLATGVFAVEIREGRTADTEGLKQRWEKRPVVPWEAVFGASEAA